MYKGKIKSDPVPISVYDVADKKLVMVFRTSSVAARYFDFHRAPTRIHVYYKTKSRCHTNRFNRVLAFRRASPEQIELMEGTSLAILDERFTGLPLLNMDDGMKDDKFEFYDKMVIKYSKINLNAVI